jgi:hypothetical protein
VQSFLQRHASEIKGVLTGFDRIRFRGSLRQLSYHEGLMKFLSAMSVLLKDFREWAQSLTEDLRSATQKLAQDAGRPIVYLQSSQTRKEDRVRQIAAKDGITRGLIAVLTCVEPCFTWHLRKNSERKLLVLEPLSGKCLFQYFYFQHPQLGLMHVRLQTWLPFTVHVCINGRDWLAKDLEQLGIPFEQRDNCFVDVSDVGGAQRLLDAQRQTDWFELLSGLLHTVHPTYATMFGQSPPAYYWSADETEWATDVMFRSTRSLAKIYPQLVRHAITTYGPGDVLRFFGRRPLVNMLTTAEVESHLGKRAEGIRVKHQLEGNSVKMYDKQGSVLRVETTINNPTPIKVLRGTEKRPDDIQLRKMRKGVGDMARRADASQSVNERYLESLAAVAHEEPLQQTIAPLCRPTKLGGRRVRALSPLNPEDSRLLAAVGRPEFMLHGFRNQELRDLLFSNDKTKTNKQQAGKVTRLIRLLRAHGLIRKVRRSHRYQLTNTGRVQITAILAAQQATTKQLVSLAA